MKIDDLRALLDAAGKATPIAWLFQHDETGRTGFIEDHMADDFFRMNPRLHRIRPVYDHAAAPPDVVAALARIALAAVAGREDGVPMTLEMRDALEAAGL